MATTTLLVGTSISIDYLRKTNKAKTILYQTIQRHQLYTYPSPVIPTMTSCENVSNESKRTACFSRCRNLS